MEVVVADIGGSHARFALADVEDGQVTNLGEAVTFTTVEHASLQTAWATFGDRVGRKSTLVASLLTMGVSTTLVGCLPTYAAAGWWAPLILCILRFGQGFGLGGEWGGAALLAVENAPPGYENRYGMFPPLGAPIGFIAANGFFLLLGTMLDDRQRGEITLSAS